MPSYQAELDRFDGVQAQVLGLSVDSVPCLQAWADSLDGITYPLLSDFYPHGKIAQLYGVLRPDGKSERAIFVIDKQGVIRYVDVHDIDQQPDNEELFHLLAEIEPELAAAQKQMEARVLSQAERAQAEVVMYCTSWCPDCRRAREFFRSQNIEYQQINIMHDRDGAQRLREWTGGDEITPTFTIDGTVLIGYSEAKLRALLGI